VAGYRHRTSVLHQSIPAVRQAARDVKRTGRAVQPGRNPTGIVHIAVDVDSRSVAGVEAPVRIAVVAVIAIATERQRATVGRDAGSLAIAQVQRALDGGYRR